MLTDLLLPIVQMFPAYTLVGVISVAIYKNYQELRALRKSVTILNHNSQVITKALLAQGMSPPEALDDIED